MKARRLAIIGVLVLAGAVAFGSVAAFGGGSGQRYSPHFAVLTGGAEIGEDGKAAAGDPDGRGSATVIVHGGGKVCFAIIVTGISKPVAAHIHSGRAGSAGDVVVPLTQPAAGNPGTSSGCVSGVKASLIAAMTKDPDGFYVNVHTGDYPGGAVRGQLF